MSLHAALLLGYHGIGHFGRRWCCWQDLADPLPWMPGLGSPGCLVPLGAKRITARTKPGSMCVAIVATQHISYSFPDPGPAHPIPPDVYR